MNKLVRKIQFTTKFQFFLLFSIALFLGGTMQAQLTLLSGDYTPTGVSSDGSVVAGYTFSDGGGNFMWTESNGYVFIGGNGPGTDDGGAADISLDGTKISATTVNTTTGLKEMGLYDVASQTWTNLGNIGGSLDDEASTGWGMSADGTTIVGLGWVGAAGTAHAIYWNEAEGTVDLGSTVPGSNSRANNANGDGSIVIGWQDADSGLRQGAFWTNGVQTITTYPNGQSTGELLASSNDGAVLGGLGNGSNNFQAFIWREATGAVNIGPPFNSGDKGSVTGLSGDGSIAVGYYRPNGPPIFGQGFIYSQTLGLLNLNQYAADNNIDTMGAVLSLPLAISEDGSTIVGLGQSAAGGFTSFILKIQQTAGFEDLTFNNLNLSPNPVVENLSIQNSELISNIVLYTVTGQKVLGVQPNQLNTTLNLEKLAAGVYFVKITSAGKTTVKKLIKR